MDNAGATATSSPVTITVIKKRGNAQTQLEGELGWRAYLTVDDDEPAEAMVYCADCAEEEFGDHPPPQYVPVACQCVPRGSGSERF
jgi:hypothetical protein